MAERKYTEILEEFKLYYPFYYNDMSDWWPSDRQCITVKLSDNTLIEYNRIGSTVRTIRYDDYDDETCINDFGKNLQKHIRLSGMTNSEVASKAGITNAMLSRYIHGSSVPSVYKARRLANILRCGLNELFDNNYEGDDIND